jgi:hypothetical protein
VVKNEPIENYKFGNSSVTYDEFIAVTDKHMNMQYVGRNIAQDME